VAVSLRHALGLVAGAARYSQPPMQSPASNNPLAWASVLAEHTRPSAGAMRCCPDRPVRELWTPEVYEPEAVLVRVAARDVIGRQSLHSVCPLEP
jgi:hypothetical protein